MFSLSDFGHTFFDSSIVGVCSIHRCKLLASGILRHKSDTCPYNFVSLELTRILFLFFLFFFQFSHTKIQLASFPLVINLLLTNPKKLKKKKKQRFLKDSSFYHMIKIIVFKSQLNFSQYFSILLRSSIFLRSNKNVPKFFQIPLN